MDDLKIIELFKTKRSDKAFVELYKIFPKFFVYIKKQGGNKTEAEDVFQDALIVIYKKSIDSNFTFNSSLKTYLFNTAKYLWWDLKKVEKKWDYLDSSQQDYLEFKDELDEFIEKEEKIKKAEHVLETLGEKCKQILVSFYFDGLKMIEISKKFNYSSEKSAKTQKFKCLEKAKNQLLNL